KRYDSKLSHLFFSSLIHRQNYLAFIVNQLPAGINVVELGCGTGRIYELLKNKDEIQYTGIDISFEAIEKARETFSKHKSARWLCLSVEEIKAADFQKADFFFSAGLIDWLNDEQIEIVNRLVGDRPFIHSLSLEEKNVKTKVHKAFSFILSLFQKINYKPRKYPLEQIESLFGDSQKIKITRDPIFSFGAFVHNLKAPLSNTGALLQTDVTTYKNYRYFSQKKEYNNFVERFFKSLELTAAQNLFKDLDNKSVLELGSGMGHYSEFFLRRKVASLTCVDPSIDTDLYVQNPGLKFISRHFESLSFQQKFDAVFAIGVLEFIEDKGLFFKKIRDASHSQTVIYIVKPDTRSLVYCFYSLFHRLSGRRLDRDTNLEELIQSNRLKILRREKFGLLNELLVLGTHE
ncbi:MAG: methyltransferase domain-containing protein, partial [Pseudobdellovibrio sp.]